jgi:hypothetical protein
MGLFLFFFFLLLINGLSLRMKKPNMTNVELFFCFLLGKNISSHSLEEREKQKYMM